MSAYGRRYVDILSRKYNLVARIAYINSEKNAIVAYTSSKSVEFAKLEYSMVPSHASSVGKMILAHLPEDELESRLSHMELTQFTDKTITDVAKLQRDDRAHTQAQAIPWTRCEYMDNTILRVLPVTTRRTSSAAYLARLTTTRT